MLNNFKWYRKLRGGDWCKYSQYTYSYHEGFGYLPKEEISWIKGGIDNLMIVSYYSDIGKLIQRIGRLRLDGSKEGNVIIFVTLSTQEEKWFNKMISQLDMSVFNVKKHADAESFIQTIK